MRAMRLQLSPAAERTARRDVADFQSDSAEILGARISFLSQLTLHVLAAMVVAAIVMAALMPIDRVVTARGRVTSVQPKMVVQPLETSIIRQINVREGQIVRAGEVLATLDPTFSGADVRMLAQRIATLEAETARLQAELRGVPFQAASTEPTEVLQERLYGARAAQYRASLIGYDEKIGAAQSLLERANKELGYYGERLGLIREIETMRTTLQERQTGSRLNTIIASDQRVEIERNVAVQRLTLESAQHQLDGLRAERDGYQRKWVADVAEQLVDKQRQLDGARDDMAKAGKRRELIDLRAVQDAVVLQIGDISIGSVVESAKKIFTLVPLGGGLQIEVEVAGNDQGFVAVGQPVVLKFDAWPYTRHGTGRGVVRSVSGDSFRQTTATGGSGPAIYLAHVDIVDSNLRGIPADFRLVPGMPVTADVAVGSRTPLGYLLDKVIPLLTEGLREP
ncbi:HlyD family type I secretion periplasmic adaptor subunit [Siculibacillus lacustris]|uniref:Membrane fusion protein (MFP) family protein n=1 Tax=Siculibacillus lacustris TaxID=1549641 RepID=A0A4Q9VDB8_9HYPH|nr:HlyD family type I secretion periplasmic adaptor subunit [Siculibacillus lacustris]TBW32656.1 HlyD family type I secretion periplasmic adaptor subunit [Siculibacillus lacustris]